MAEIPPRSELAAEAAAGIGALAARYGLAESQAEQLTELFRVVTTDSHAPTTARSPRAVLNDHLADSLVALELEPVRSAHAIVDIGAGAGFPGLALAIARPDARVDLVESNRRKTEFIARAVAMCGIENARAVNARAEEWREGFDCFDLATARALAPLAVVAEYAAPLLRVGGTLVAWRGRREPEVEAAANSAAQELGLRAGAVVPVAPYSEAEHRFLHLMSKVKETPARFPRRPGMATKRPLGAT